MITGKPGGWPGVRKSRACTWYLSGLSCPSCRASMPTRFAVRMFAGSTDTPQSSRNSVSAVSPAPYRSRVIWKDLQSFPGELVRVLAGRGLSHWAVIVSRPSMGSAPRMKTTSGTSAAFMTAANWCHIP